MDEVSNHFPRPDPFFDRKAELVALQRAWEKRKSGLAMLYGRRRLGKTYLLQRFLSDVYGASGRCYYLADQSTAEVQRRAMAERLIQAFPSGLSAPDIATSWNSLLRYFSARAKDLGAQGRAALILDEFPYLVSQTPELPSVLQAWWDEEGAHTNVFVVLCGSQLSTMTALDHGTAPLHGRFNAGRIRLEPMGYHDIATFYDRAPSYGIVEKLLMYGALGGSPRYHGEADPRLPWDEQIVDLLFRQGAPFENEARSLLASEQVRDPAPYNAILAAIAAGNTRHSEIQNATGLAATAITYPLNTLIDLEWVRKERSFGETTDRRSVYRLADPFLQFWYRFGVPLASALRFEEPMDVFRKSIEPRLDDYMGWSVFEDICAQWLLRRGSSEVGCHARQVSRYWSRDGNLEIDQVAELDDGRYLFGECKWSARSKIGSNVYTKLRAKVERLPNEIWKRDAHYALYSVGGFTDELRALAKSDGNVTLVDGNRLF